MTWPVPFPPQLALAALLLGAGSLYEWWRDARARELIADWARRRHFRIRACRRAWLGRGPFVLTTSRYQLVYRLELDDLRLGGPCTAWARCGTRFLGRLSDDAVDVRVDGFPGAGDLRAPLER